MLSPKLLSLLETLDKYRRNRFRKFLSSPYFNENEDLLKLFDVVDAFLRKRESAVVRGTEQLEKEVVWKKLFGRAPYQDNHLRRLSSELLHLGYDFIYVEACLDDKAQAKAVLLHHFKRPEMEKHFRGLARQLKSLEKEQKGWGARRFYTTHQYELAFHQQLEGQEDKVEDFSHLERADEVLSHFFFVQKLKHLGDALGYQAFLAKTPRIAMPPGLMEYLEQSGLLENPLLRAYYLVVKMLKEPEEDRYFFQLKSLFFEQLNAFAPEELHPLYIHLNNYCIQHKINAGISSYFHELFDLYKQGIETGLMLREDVLPAQDYKNIITVGLHVGAFDWVEQFIQKFTGHLPEARQENALAYNLAKVYFHQAEYEKVIGQLREVEYQSLAYALGSKMMLLRTYYELGEFLALDSLAESFRIYLRRKREISRDVRQQYMNVLRFVRKLSRLDPRDQAAIGRTRKEVEECNALAAKKWVLEKVEELEKN
ncbi:MAG: hypothetical protein KDD19_19450 [Phaeodactylibacter sp.]|nr:hypothetical protein [Phaeodactylibacter sp.]MCB9054105.1 hypothetical protein [Lewinellaceae bacterium]